MAAISPAETARALRACRLFGSLSDAEAGLLLRQARGRRHPGRSAVYSAGDCGAAVFVLVSGRVSLAGHAGDGRPALLGFAEPGDLFGEVPAFDGRPHDNTAMAAVDCLVVAVPAPAFRTLLTIRGDLAVAAAQLIAARRGRAEARLCDALTLPGRPRLARVLAEVVTRHGDRVGDRRVMRFTLSHRELAALAGVSRGTATRLWGELQARGLIFFERGRLVVPDPDRLLSVTAPSATPRCE